MTSDEASETVEQVAVFFENRSDLKRAVALREAVEALTKPRPTIRQPIGTHTFAELEVSASTYNEIYKLLDEAGYTHAFIDGLIDMHGIALDWPRCHVCGDPAVCVGEYESCTGVDVPACAKCCAHGNEDGHCTPIERMKP